MIDLDDTLARFAAMSAPASLRSIDNQVLARIGLLSTTTGPSFALLGGSAAAIAIVMGMTISGVTAARRPPPTRELAVLTTQSPYAPSTLLGL